MTLCTLPQAMQPYPLRPRCRSRSARRAALLGALLLGCQALPAFSQQSPLLDAVKQNPGRGQTLCKQLRQLNAEGVSFTAARVTAMVSAQQGLSQADSEVLLTYVVGLYCPDVR